STPALPPLATTFCSELSRFFGLQTLSINLNHLPPSIPVSRVANMRSVQTTGSTHAHRARTSPSCGPPRGLPEVVVSLLRFSPFPPSLSSSLRVPPPPPFDDPVSFDYGQPVFCPMGTSTPRLVRTLRRTSTGFQPVSGDASCVCCFGLPEPDKE